jgi:hypothetical protein
LKAIPFLDRKVPMARRKAQPNRPIKNAAYSQMERLRELFDVSRRHETRSRPSTPDLRFE